MIRLTFFNAIVAVVLSIFTAGGRAGAAGPVELDDSALPLARSEVRSEAEQDRMAAVSLFAAGRMLEQRQELPGALRRYERAFRLDPTAEPVLREIIPLAFSLSREEEAVRYATKLAAIGRLGPGSDAAAGRRAHRARGAQAGDSAV